MIRLLNVFIKLACRLHCGFYILNKCSLFMGWICWWVFFPLPSFLPSLCLSFLVSFSVSFFSFLSFVLSFHLFNAMCFFTLLYFMLGCYLLFEKNTSPNNNRTSSVCMWGFFCSFFFFCPLLRVVKNSSLPSFIAFIRKTSLSSMI